MDISYNTLILSLAMSNLQMNPSKAFLFLFKKILFIYLFLERGEGREKEKERNINVWLPLMRPLLGSWPATQACALNGDQTREPLVHRLMLNPLSHTSQDQRHFSFYYSVYYFLHFRLNFS